MSAVQAGTLRATSSKSALAEVAVPPSYFFVERVMWGVMAMLAQLHAPADWRALIDARRRACADFTSITTPAPEGVSS